MLESLHQALALLPSRVAAPSARWMVVGSVAPFLQGLHIWPRDIDLLAPDEGDAHLLVEPLKEFEERGKSS